MCILKIEKFFFFFFFSVVEKFFPGFGNFFFSFFQKFFTTIKNKKKKKNLCIINYITIYGNKLYNIYFTNPKNRIFDHFSKN